MTNAGSSRFRIIARGRRRLQLSLGGALVFALLAWQGGGLPAVRGQTAGPVATPARPVVAGPQNGGVALLPNSAISSISERSPASTVPPAAGASVPGGAAPPQPTAQGAQPGQPAVLAPTVNQGSNPPPATGASSGPAAAAASQPVAFRGQAIAVAPAPANDLNLTVAGGVSLVAGQSLIYVPAEASSCDARAELTYTRDQALFTATCANGSSAQLSQPATLCFQPSPQIMTPAKGNLANLSVTAAQPLSSHPTSSGVLVCAQAPGPGTYTLSVTGTTPAPAPLHTLPMGVRVQLPAVGLGSGTH